MRDDSGRILEKHNLVPGEKNGRCLISSYVDPVMDIDRPLGDYGIVFKNQVSEIRFYPFIPLIIQG